MKTAATFDSIAVGDVLQPLEVEETQETIDSARNPERIAESPRQNIHNDPEFARAGLFAGTVNAGVTTMAYIVRLLEQWFPPDAFYRGGSLTYKGIQPFRPGDRVVFTGKVTAKREERGRGIVELEVAGTNQRGQLVGAAEATVTIDVRASTCPDHRSVRERP